MRSEKEINKLLFDFSKDGIIKKDELSKSRTKDLMRYYEITAMETKGRIHALYSKYAIDNKITVTEARALISADEQNTFKMKLSEYMAKISAEGAESKTKIELDRLALKSRLSREEKLLADINMAMGEMADKTAEVMGKEFKSIVADNFIRSAYEVQKAMGVSFAVDNLSDRAIKMIVEHKWAKNDFSRSLWGHMDTFHKQLREVLATGFMSGSSVDKMVREMQKRTGACRKACFRLIQNQCQYFANEGERQGYKANGIEKYVFMGTNETRLACECSSLNKVVIKLEDAVPLINFPPLHPHCICTTRAYFENSILNDNSNTRPFDEGMSMGDWRKNYVRKNEEDLLKGLKEELGCDIIKSEKTDRVNKSLAGKASYIIHSKGGIDLNLYDDKGYITKTFTNNDHGNPSKHKFGKLGEHVHDWVKDKKGNPVKKYQREITEEEKNIMGRIM